MSTIEVLGRRMTRVLLVLFVVVFHFHHRVVCVAFWMEQ